MVTSASGGYIVGFVFAAAVTGFLAERRWDRRLSSSIGSMLTGNVIIYLVGLPWLAVVLHTNLEKTLEFGLYPFVPGDIFKLYVAAGLLPGAWKIVERIKRASDMSIVCDAWIEPTSMRTWGNRSDAGRSATTRP